MVKDLTQGKPMRIIIGFAIPLLLGMLFQQFYSLVDTVIVGKTLGVDALAAVGSTGSINFLIIGFCMGACAGFTIPIAQRFGPKTMIPCGNMWRIPSGFRNFCGGNDHCDGGIVPFHSDLDAYPGKHSGRSVSLYCGDFCRDSVTYLYNLLSGIIRSLGDSKTPVYFLVLSSILNIALVLPLFWGYIPVWKELPTQP